MTGTMIMTALDLAMKTRTTLVFRSCVDARFRLFSVNQPEPVVDGVRAVFAQVLVDRVFLGEHLFYRGKVIFPDRVEADGAKHVIDMRKDIPDAVMPVLHCLV